MKHTLKKSLAIILAAATLLCCAPLSGLVGLELSDLVTLFASKAEAATKYKEGYYTYTVDGNGNATITDATASGNIAIPSTLGGHPVTSIGEEAFEECYNITSVTIPNGVTSIGDWAFFHCYNLVSVTIPGSVTSIGSCALATGTASITVDPANNHYSDDGYGVLFNKDKTKLIQYPAGNERTTYIIPDSVTIIGDNAFRDCTNLINIIISNRITKIATYAFSSCDNLASITIPDSVTVIDDYAFCCCESLTSIIIPDSVTSIGVWAFWSCDNLESVTISGVTTVGWYAFKDCTALTKITISDNVHIADDAFYNTGYYNDPNNWENYVLYIGKHLIKVRRSISGSYVIKKGTLTIADCAFEGCDSITNVKIPDSVIFIGEGAFAYCDGLSSVVVPDSVTTIGESAFYISDYKNFKYLHIPTSTSSIGSKVVISDVYICSETEDCYARQYAIMNGIEFRLCDGHATNNTDNPSKENIYNLGEETYHFENFGDFDSPFGHCFGMSITSSGYYLNILDVNNVGIDSADEVNALTLSNDVKEPICYYQMAQNYSLASTVAGGTYYKTYDPKTRTGVYDIQTDWNEVVNYVKDHSYDNKGVLQIGFRKENSGGHAINFLKYEEVNGQPRIYVYDNNFPDIETYFYEDANGDIVQSPEQTFFGNIDCISLRNVETYFNLATDFDMSNCFYADKDSVIVNGAKAYPMETGDETKEYVMFEVPDGTEHVTITPLVDNATFIYLNKKYAFGDIDEGTVGVFTLSLEDDISGEQIPHFEIRNDSNSGVEVEIRRPSTTTIKYGDSITLHVGGEIPAGYTVEWTASNSNFSYKADGSTCTISPEKSGDTTFTATIYDANGNPVSTDEQTMTAKAGFFQKIIAFFKKLFGLTKTIPQAFKGII